MYNLSDYDYYLDPSLIAQKPADKRQNSRLMVLDRKKLKICHTYFYKIIDYLDKDDVLVLNNTKVMPARIFGKKKTGGKVEFLLLHNIKDNIWNTLIRMKGQKVGSKVFFQEDLEAEILDFKEKDSSFIVKFNKEVFPYLNKFGQVPFPPYVKNRDIPSDRYQTVYAKVQGSVAAPTAGLHFTEQLLNSLKNKISGIFYITLHVSWATFRPIKTDNILNHKMGYEFYRISQEVANQLNYLKSIGKKIIAVGTTTTRTLESASDNNGILNNLEDKTNLYIYPGYKFKFVDKLITNFHLPKTSLLVLVSAFAGRDFIFKAYKEAIEKRYRFFSFGDAMFIK